MAIGRGKLEKLLRNELKKSPRKGRKKVSKKKTSKKDIQSAISGLFGGTGGGRGEPKDLPESITIPGIGEIELPKQKRKTKAKKADAKPDIGRPKKVKGGKKRPPKVRITEAKPKVKPIDIPEIINIPGIGQIEVPKAKPKPKPKAKAKVKARPKPKPRPVKLPDELIDENLREDIRITPGMLEGLIGGEKISAPTAPKPPVDTPKGKSQEVLDALERIDTGGITGGVPDRGGINPGMGVYRPDGTEYRLADPDFDYQAMIRGEYLTEKPAPPRLEVGPMPVPGPAGPPIFDEGPREIPQDVIDRIEVGREPAPDLPPAPEPPTRVDTTPEPAPPPPPQFIDMDPLKGMRDTIIPRNILGQSFDPSVRDDYEKQMQAARAAMMQPGGNVRASEYPTYQTPTLAVPQTQFGGYGQPMPVAPLLPYAGLATATPPQEIPRPPASGARVNPGTGQIEPEGIAPPPRVTNLPPGVTGPIR